MPGKSYRAWSPDQPFLLPPSPGEWLPEDHIARFVLELVRELDITAIETTIQSKDPRGERPYDPRMMMGLLVYGHVFPQVVRPTPSVREIERKTHEDPVRRTWHSATSQAASTRSSPRSARSGVRIWMPCMTSFGRSSGSLGGQAS